MAVERITKYNVSCTRSSRENDAKTEANAPDNPTPIKPERKSRVSSAELKKPKADDEVNGEATNLLINSEKTAQQQKARSKRDESYRFCSSSNIF